MGGAAQRALIAHTSGRLPSSTGTACILTQSRHSSSPAACDPPGLSVLFGSTIRTSSCVPAGKSAHGAVGTTRRNRSAHATECASCSGLFLRMIVRRIRFRPSHWLPRSRPLPRRQPEPQQQADAERRRGEYVYQQQYPGPSKSEALQLPNGRRSGQFEVRPQRLIPEQPIRLACDERWGRSVQRRAAGQEHRVPVGAAGRQRPSGLSGKAPVRLGRGGLRDPA